MTSAPTSQPNSFLALDSTAELDSNSLQLNHVPLEGLKSPDETSYNDASLMTTGLSTKTVMDPPPTHATSSMESSATPSAPQRPNPDDTIQDIVTNPASPSRAPEIQTVKQEPVPQQSIPVQSQPIIQSPARVQLHLPTSEPIYPKMEAAVATVPGSIKADAPETRAASAHGNAKVSAYARLEFENFIFYVQTLQVILGRKSENDQSHSVDVHLGQSKAISRKHAKIFYNFGTERFELSIQGKNGAFVDDIFVERGATVPLTNKSKIQIGQIVFRFVLPGVNGPEKGESPSKALNPSDAVSLKSTLYTNQGDDDVMNGSGENTPSLTSKDFVPINENSALSASADVGDSSVPKPKPPKEKKSTRVPKPPKKVYTLEEIPEEYRTKPNCSYSNLIATCLRTHGTPKGMSLAEIYKSIRDIFPYYKYCPDGWQSSVRHNLSLNKAFRKVSKEGKGWLWGLDEEYCAEKEKAKKKQQQAAAAKAKAAALKIEQQQIQQKQQEQKHVHMLQGTPQQFQQHQQGVLVPIASLQGVQLQPNPQLLQAKSIPLQTLDQSQQMHQVQQQQQQQQQQHAVPLAQQGQAPQMSVSPAVQQQPPNPVTQQQNHQQQSSVASQQQQQTSKTPSIQAQLAANRRVAPAPATAPKATPPSQTKPSPLGADTKKALSHLQQQLVLLSKDLRNLVDKPTISAILTQAIAMTIAQVTQAAKAKGITSDPLATLIETNPQQLTKILTVALNAATYKVTNGRIKSPLSVSNTAPPTRTATPANSSPASTPQPQRPQPSRNVQQPQPRVQSQMAVSVHQAQQQQINQQQQSQPLHQQQPAQHQQPPPLTVAQSQVSTLQPVCQQPPPSGESASEKAQPVVKSTTGHQSLAAPVVVQQTKPAVQSLPPPQQTAQSATPPAQPATLPARSDMQSAVQTMSQAHAVTTAPVKSNVSAPALQNASQLPKSSSPSPAGSTPQSNQNFASAAVRVTAQSTPYTHASNTDSPQIPIVNSPCATQQDQLDSTSQTPHDQKLETSSTPVSEKAIKLTPASPKVIVASPVKTDEPSTQQQVQPHGSSTASVTPVSAQESTPVPSVQPTQSSTQSAAHTTSDTTVAHPTDTKQESFSISNEEPDLSFLDEGFNHGLDDPELDKVLQSLSKEGTPGLDEDNEKMMNDEELNMLLAQDFSGATTTGVKRTFDDVEKSLIIDDEFNKVAKME